MDLKDEFSFWIVSVGPSFSDEILVTYSIEVDAPAN
jgi:hypothetical protein